MTPIVAVVPFGAFAEESKERAGAWARSLARRLVDRFAGAQGIELRPVLLVAMPKGSSDPSYLVMGSAPDTAKAAEYARSLGATYALVGTYREVGGVREAHLRLVEESGSQKAEHRTEVAPEALHLLEPELAQWIARATHVSVDRDLTTPATANEDSYGALLQAMDSEVDATLLRESDPRGSQSALARAAATYTIAAQTDPTSSVVEERILVMAASAIETDRQPLVLETLETLAETRAQSWRVQYVLGEVRRTSGDVSGAIVAFEHSDALKPLRAQDVLTLARLYITAGAPAVAASRLRRVIRSDAEAPVVAAARRLQLGIRHPELERDLEEAGKAAVDGDLSHALEAQDKFDRVLAADPDIWEAHFGSGLLAWHRGDSAAAEASFKRAIEIDPEAAELVSEMGEPPTN